MPTDPTRRPDRIVTYAGSGARQLGVTVAAIAALMILLELLLYEVLGDRDDLAEDVVRGLAKSLVPIGAVLVLVRRARR